MEVRCGPGHGRHCGVSLQEMALVCYTHARAFVLVTTWHLAWARVMSNHEVRLTCMVRHYRAELAVQCVTAGVTWVLGKASCVGS